MVVNTSPPPSTFGIIQTLTRHSCKRCCVYTHTYIKDVYTDMHVHSHIHKHAHTHLWLTTLAVASGRRTPDTPALTEERPGKTLKALIYGALLKLKAMKRCGLPAPRIETETDAGNERSMRATDAGKSLGECTQP